LPHPPSCSIETINESITKTVLKHEMGYSQDTVTALLISPRWW
jgi:hypothetical protein